MRTTRAVAVELEHLEDQQFRDLLFTFGARADRGYDGQDCEGRAPNLTDASSAVSPQKERGWSLSSSVEALAVAM